ncbi:MAG: hypothetical protein ACLSE6_00840 [Alphaproteobacteria bacterium]
MPPTARKADISRHQDPTEQAAWFAAYKEAGIEPESNPFYSNKSKIRNLPESARKQLKGHNAETVGKLYEAAKAHAVADMAKNPTKEFDLRTSKAKDPKSAALLYAAYTAAGAKVVGMEEVNKDSQGMFQSETLGFMPEEAQKIVSDYNYGIRKEQLEAKRKEAEYAYRAAVMSPNPTPEQLEIIARHDERNAALTARGQSTGTAERSGAGSGGPRVFGAPSSTARRMGASGQYSLIYTTKKPSNEGLFRLKKRRNRSMKLTASAEWWWMRWFPELKHLAFGDAAG